MFQLKHTPTLLATPGPVQINTSSPRWNSNEDKQHWVLPSFPWARMHKASFHNLLQDILQSPASCKWGDSCLFMARVTDHLSFPRPAQLTNKSAVCTTVKLSWPRKGTLEYIIAPEKHAQKVSKLETVRGVNIFPFLIHAITAFKLSNEPFFTPHHNPLDMTS